MRVRYGNPSKFSSHGFSSIQNKKKEQKKIFCMLPCLQTRAPGVNSHDIHTLAYKIDYRRIRKPNAYYAFKRFLQYYTDIIVFEFVRIYSCQDLDREPDMIRTECAGMRKKMYFSVWSSRINQKMTIEMRLMMVRRST